jgi:hypothetical protein
MPDAPVSSATVPPPSPSTFEEFQKSTPSLSKFKTPVDLAKSYLELEKNLGNRIPLPQSDDPKEWDAVYAKLGRPEKPEGYSRLDMKENPEAVNVDPEFMDDFYKIAYSKGLTNRQANDMLQDIYARVGKQQKASALEEQMENERVESDLNQAFGVARPKVEEGIKRFLAERGQLDAFEKKGLLKDPTVAVLLHNIQKDYVQDHAITKPQHRDLGSQIPQELEARKQTLMASPEYKKGSQKVVDEVNQLYQLIEKSRSGNPTIFKTVNK